jgi:hypothetical protein
LQAACQRRRAAAADKKAFEINSRARASIRLKDAMFQAPFQRRFKYVSH